MTTATGWQPNCS